MRQGINPFKATKSPIPRPKISAGIVTHYTANDYHKQRLDIVRMCIKSIARACPDELIIWDNGSTPEFRAMLRSLNPDVLIESTNIGLDTAKHNLFNIARGEIFCYSDDDVLHEPGWLDRQLEILKVYPHVGVVSGSPQRVHFKWATAANLEMASIYKMKVERGKLIPEEYERDYAASIGIEYAGLRKSTEFIQDVLLEYQGVKAWAHGHHFQFTCHRKEMARFFTPSDFYMSNARPIDEAIDKAGYMRMTTYERTCKHLGNVI